MTDDKRLDESISRLVRGIQMDIPPSLEEEIHRKSAALKLRPDLPSYPSAFVDFIAQRSGLDFGGFAPLAGADEAAISEFTEIRTQFEIADKNITIVFYQKISILRLLRRIKCAKVRF